MTSPEDQEPAKPANVLRLEEMIRQGLVIPRKNQGPRRKFKPIKGVPKDVVDAIIADR